MITKSLARDVFTVRFQIIDVLEMADLGFKISLPFASNVRAEKGESDRCERRCEKRSRIGIHEAIVLLSNAIVNGF